MKNSRVFTKKIKMIFLAVLIGALCLPSCVCVAASYQYNENDQAIAAPVGYEAVGKVRSSDVGANLSFSPADMVLDDGGELHLLDQENGCVFVFDRALKYRRTVVFLTDGEEEFLTGLNGFCVKGKGENLTYFVADTDNKRVFLADAKGNIFREIGKPNAVAFDEKTTFAPTKVGLDSNENLYVLASGIYQGIAVFSGKDDYEFITFLGGNTVESTGMVLADYFWKQIFNKKQISSMRRYVPVPAANFVINDENQVFTVTNKSAKGTNFENEIKQFNANNVNIIKNQDWGDLELAPADNGLKKDTSYVDIAVNDSGIMAALDGNLCRVSVFTVTGERLFTFGEKGNTVGNFDIPVAIEMDGDHIYVADSAKQSVTMFAPTAYGKEVLCATGLYLNGEYDKAFPLWRKIAQKNGGSMLSYVGMGKYYLAKKDYVKAMDCFRQGADRKGYSQAFSLKRSQDTQRIFPLIAVIFLTGFIVLLVVDAKIKDKRKKQVNPAEKRIFGRIWYTLFHPCEGGMLLARKTDVSITLATSAVLLIAWFLASICKWCFSGFIFNTNIPADFNIWLQLVKTVGLFSLWIVSLWLITNLMDCSGRFTDLIIVSAVALIPYIIGLFAYVGMSNLLVLEESGYITVVQVLALLWSAAVLWGGLREVNEMSFSGTLLCIVFTLLGMALVIFLMILLWSLFQQFISFAAQILIELKKMIG